MSTSTQNLCQIEYLLTPPAFDLQSSEKVDVVVTSLFRMKGGGYKSFSKYLRGLERSIKLFHKHLPQLYFLLYIDDSVTHDTELYTAIKAMDNKRLFIAHYTCPIGLDAEGGHIELYGSMVRFLPFFESDSNFTRTAICIDADSTWEDIHRLVDNYRIFISISSQYHFDTNPFYELLTTWSRRQDYSVLAGRHMCKYKFPLSLLTDFVTCSKKLDCPDMPNIRTLLSYNKYATYPYGIDECFLNWVLIPYIQKHNITYSINIRYSITAPFYVLECAKTITPGTPADSTLNRGLKTVLNLRTELTIPTPTLISKFDATFEAFIYGNAKALNPNAHAIARRYYDFLAKLDAEQDYSIFPSYTLHKILNDRDYITKRSFIIYYSPTIARTYLYREYMKVQ